MHGVVVVVACMIRVKLGLSEVLARVAGRLERDRLAAAPAGVPRNSIGAKVTLTGDQVHERLGPRVVDAVGTNEAGCVWTNREQACQQCGVDNTSVV